MPQTLFYCNPLLVIVIILPNISLNLGLTSRDLKPRNKNINLFTPQLSSEGLSEMFSSTVLLNIHLVYFSNI